MHIIVENIENPGRVAGQYCIRKGDLDYDISSKKTVKRELNLKNEPLFTITRFYCEF